MRVLLPFLLILVSSCTPSLMDVTEEMERDPSSGFIIEGVPFFPMEGWMCGPSSLASVLNYHGEEVDPEEIASKVYRQDLRGSLLMDLLLYAKERGFYAVYYSGGLDDLKSKLSKGIPLILFLNLGHELYPVGHYVVATGYSDRAQVVIVHSALEREKVLGYRWLFKRWKKTGFSTLLVLPRGDVRRAEEHIKRARLLEREGNTDKALEEYNMAIRVDPPQPDILFAMADILIKKGDLERAEGYLLRAVELDPGNGIYYNNLAWVYMELGRHTHAERYIKKALTIDPARRHIYLDTLGTLEMEGGRLDEAERILLDALSSTPQDDRYSLSYICSHLHELYTLKGCNDDCLRNKPCAGGLTIPP